MEDLTASIEKLKAGIQKLQDDAEVASQSGDDENLSITLQSLARKNSALGQRAAYAKYISRNAQRVVDSLKEEKDAKRSQYTLTYSEQQAVGKSEHQAKVKVHDLYSEKIEEAFRVYSESRLVADEADDLTYRTDTYCKLAQSRLSLLKADKNRG